MRKWVISVIIVSATAVSGLCDAPPQLDNDSFIAFDARHGELRKMAWRPSSVVRYSNTPECAAAMAQVRKNATKRTQEQGARAAVSDGLPSAGEIASMSVNADLVVLSACNTAAADSRPGAEGLSGLARSFIGAGAKSLVVSHWPVVSDATTSLMTAFAKELADGKLPAAAMRGAMLSQLQSAKTDYRRHPVFWAPFFVVGAR